MEKEKSSIIVNKEDVEGFEGICGLVKELISPDNSNVENLSIALITVESGKSSDPHFHKNIEEVYFILEGEGEILINKKREKIRSGDVIFIPPRKAHQLINKGDKLLSLLSIDSPPYNPEDTYEIEKEDVGDFS